MDRPDYLANYNFNWDTIDIMASGKSSLDAKNYLNYFKEKEDAYSFLSGYGYDLNDPIQNAEMFGNFQEAIQFIKKYFLKEGNQDGLDLQIPNVFYTITDVSDLLLITTRVSDSDEIKEDAIWASIILKVMHTILHLDKDLRHRYYTTIQTQIFDRFYKYLHREDDELYLENDEKTEKIPLVDFEAKSKKSRESIIIKLLHKKENVAEELFDRIGIRFITHTKIDALRVLRFLYRNYIVIVNNIKPSRTQNSLINYKEFIKDYRSEIKNAIKHKTSEDEFASNLEKIADKYTFEDTESYKNNQHTSSKYKAIHFTCRQLIKYKNPFYQQFSIVRDHARKNDPEGEVSKKLLDLDTTSIAKDISFFYPYEIQVTDIKSHKDNTEGEASHLEYKRSQVISAMKRLFRPLIEFKNIDLD